MVKDRLIKAEEILSSKRKRKVNSVLPKGERMLEDMNRVLKNF